MACFVLAAVRLDYDGSGLQFPLWGRGGLSVVDGENVVVGLAAALEGDLVGELWRRLELLVDELDSEVA